MRDVRALDRARALGIRVWDDPEYCGAVLRALPDILGRGSVAPHDAASFKKQCRQAWAHLLREPALWPWSDEAAVTVVVTEAGQVRSLSVAPDVTLVVPDDDDQTKQSLIALTARPVLVADAGDGPPLAELLRRHDFEVQPTSEVSVEVYCDDELVVADPALHPFVTDDRQWIVTIVALVAELKSGPFTRHTEQSIRQILDRLRAVRIVRADDVRLILGGEEVAPPAQTTSLPIEDAVAPTIVAWPTGLDVYTELENCAASIATLVGQPLLADALQLVFTRLGQAKISPSDVVTDEELANALQVSEAQVKESRSELRGPLVGLLNASVCWSATSEATKRSRCSPSRRATSAVTQRS